ncbi:MAG: hypothetical protein ABS72_01875 [Paludibacter sp. SCN 50-10]|nr:MAG: hypothetical protein ABS72_01875 [Paludibacter sp. SCN 50-10]
MTSAKKNSLPSNLIRQLFTFSKAQLSAFSGGLVDYLITSYLKTDYYISRLFTDGFVSFVFNYNLQKYWVFKKSQEPKTGNTPTLPPDSTN